MCFRFRLLLVAIFVLAVPSVFAQRERDTYTGTSLTFEVSGEVRLPDNAGAAQRASVRLERFTGGIVDEILTDNRGRFRFPGLPRGYYKVIVNAPGYRPVQQDADLQVLFRIYLVVELVADNSKNSSGAAISTDVVDARIPATAREEFSNGRAALARKDYKEAITHLEKAISGYATFYDAQVLLGTAFMDLKEWDNAERALLRGVEMKPADAKAMIALGEVYWRQKRNSEAEKMLLEALKLNDKAWQGHFTLGRLYWDMGDVMKASGPIGMTLQLRPDLAEAHLVAGNILLRVNQRERALVEYREYLRLAPKGEFVGQVQELVSKVEKTLHEQH